MGSLYFSNKKQKTVLIFLNIESTNKLDHAGNMDKHSIMSTLIQGVVLFHVEGLDFHNTQ